jgi:hypothetical protein
MRKAETFLGSLTAALALVALALSLTQQVVEYASAYGGPSGYLSGYLFAVPMAFNIASLPVTLAGSGALLVCLGALVDARIYKRSRLAPLVMVIAGAIFCALATLVVIAANLWLYTELLSSGLYQPLRLVADVAQIPHVSLVVLYAPVAVVSGASVLTALLRRQSRPHA